MLPRFLLMVGATLGVAGGLLLFTEPAGAAGVVGTGTPGSCTDAALTTALSGGGLVTFNCGPDPAAIIISLQSITVDTTIDGGGLLTLSGGNTNALFRMPSGSLTLRNITLSNGNSGTSVGGAIRNIGPGTLTLINSTIQNSTSSIAGGALSSSRR